jgi:anti-anti-sigma regulatory factor
MIKSHFSIQQHSQIATIHLIGVLDEEMNLEKIHLEKVKELILDFGKVTSLRSTGVRELMQMLEHQPVPKITFVRCPKVVVDQINMVQGFLPDNASVASFFVPYYSEETDEEARVLFRRGFEFDGDTINPPQTIVDSKGNKMEMDVFTQDYFRFLQKQARSKAS